jgi:hypothetical protein
VHAGLGSIRCVNDERIKLNTSRRARHGFIALAAVIGSLMAVSAAPAMASLHWSDTTHGIKVGGSLTVSKSGWTSKTCTAPEVQQSSMFGTGGVIWTQKTNESLVLPCSGSGSLEMEFLYNATSTSKVELFGIGAPFLVEPWNGHYTQIRTPALGDFTNGSGATSSILVFSKDEIGFDENSKNSIYITGTLKVTTSTGGLLTLQP